MIFLAGIKLLFEAGARKIIEQGAAVELVDAFDAPSVDRALHRADPEIVINQLTALPKDPADMHRYLPGDTKLRLEGGGNIHRAALAQGVRRYIQQSSGFFLKPGKGLADESESMAIDASPDVATWARMYAELEARTLSSEQMEGQSCPTCIPLMGMGLAGRHH